MYDQLYSFVSQTSSPCPEARYLLPCYFNLTSMINPSAVIIGLQAPGSQAVVRDSKNTMQQPPRRHLPRYVSGVAGLARILDIPVDAARMMLDSGVIEEAVQRNGPEGVIIIDWEKAVLLWEAIGGTTAVEEG